MSQIPELPEIPGLYKPEFQPEDGNLVRRVPPAVLETFEQARQRALERIAREKDLRETTISPFETGEGGGSSPGTRRPLTFEEAVAVEAEKNRMIDEIKRTRARIAAIKNEIKEQMKGDGTDVLQFDVDVSKKFRLRLALSKAFGLKFFKKESGTITYPMYLAALEARRQLEQKEAEDYTSGNWEESEEESE